jgi:hypothetical protein
VQPQQQVQMHVAGAVTGTAAVPVAVPVPVLPSVARMIAGGVGGGVGGVGGGSASVPVTRQQTPSSPLAGPAVVGFVSGKPCHLLQKRLLCVISYTYFLW